MIRTKGEAGTGNVVEAVRHLRQIQSQIDSLANMTPARLSEFARETRVPLELVEEVRTLKRLPVVNFAAGGIATPADAALCRLLGADGVFVGSGIFKAQNPAKVASAIVEASLHYTDAALLARVSSGLGEPMRGIEISTIPPGELLQVRE